MARWLENAGVLTATMATFADESKYADDAQLFAAAVVAVGR